MAFRPGSFVPFTIILECSMRTLKLRERKLVAADERTTNCRRLVQSGKRKTYPKLHSKDLKDAGPMVKTNQENRTTKRV
jgi:hypothetical protein